MVRNRIVESEKARGGTVNYYARGLLESQPDLESVTHSPHKRSLDTALRFQPADRAAGCPWDDDRSYDSAERTV